MTPDHPWSGWWEAQRRAGRVQRRGGDCGRGRGRARWRISRWRSWTSSLAVRSLCNMAGPWFVEARTAPRRVRRRRDRAVAARGRADGPRIRSGADSGRRGLGAGGRPGRGNCPRQAEVNVAATAPRRRRGGLPHAWSAGRRFTGSVSRSVIIVGAPPRGSDRAGRRRSGNDHQDGGCAGGVRANYAARPASFEAHGDLHKDAFDGLVLAVAQQLPDAV